MTPNFKFIIPSSLQPNVIDLFYVCIFDTIWKEKKSIIRIAVIASTWIAPFLEIKAL